MAVLLTDNPVLPFTMDVNIRDPPLLLLLVTGVLVALMLFCCCVELVQLLVTIGV